MTSRQNLRLQCLLASIEVSKIHQHLNEVELAEKYFEFVSEGKDVPNITSDKPKSELLDKVISASGLSKKEQ